LFFFIEEFAHLVSNLRSRIVGLYEIFKKLVDGRKDGR
jgi:hypothetical protein